MTVAIENVFSRLPEDLAMEQFSTLASSPNVTIERIVSHGHASSENFWYDQDRAEWVILLAGSAGLQFEGEAEPRVLNAGNYVHIPAHLRHRVAWTDRKLPTVWLAVHYG